jgi:hypothetical protein|tara:strand:- start:529 stop:711 length:183 start_codon:yes stop_codon:yes gene_type:complete
MIKTNVTPITGISHQDGSHLAEYKLVVEAGTYSSDSLMGLLYTVFSHRMHHLIKYGKWED